MIGWHTDNSLSKTVLSSIPNIELRHVKDFNTQAADNHVFYGLLRGASNAMHALKHTTRSYYYIDNGYFDALYVDKTMQKDMRGKFRVVKNGMHDVYPKANEQVSYIDKLLIIPPSPYSANFYDTTPEDWLQTIYTLWPKSKTRVRDKHSPRPLEQDLAWCDGVKSFNSMVIMEAVRLGKVVSDDYGIFCKGFSTYNIDDLRSYYEPRQFTLDEFREGKWQPN